MEKIYPISRISSKIQTRFLLLMKPHTKLFLLLLIVSIILIPRLEQGSSLSTTPLFVLGGSQGSEEGTQFVEPEGVAFSEEGMIFCSDVDNDRIQVYFSNGTSSGLMV